MKPGYVYIMSNKNRTVLYIGMTNNLVARVLQHRSNESNYTSKYKCYDLIYWEYFQRISDAIGREKQLKNWHREWKWNLIKEMNPNLKDLFEEINDEF
ncbi:GIY-YIG nuclease family protein [Marinoscillum pacificum]|uniref:GIY-YIG nuclease family protein n=1 Tax=Marinoscillum pacificum TaxID=392723 RepID=UPI002157AA95|nr:GIY-YIG nuclease family protein [Marinoscillum pacificum]